MRRGAGNQGQISRSFPAHTAPPMHAQWFTNFPDHLPGFLECDRSCMIAGGDAHLRQHRSMASCCMGSITTGGGRQNPEWNLAACDAIGEQSQPILVDNGDVPLLEMHIDAHEKILTLQRYTLPYLLLYGWRQACAVRGEAGTRGSATLLHELYPLSSSAMGSDGYEMYRGHTSGIALRDGGDMRLCALDKGDYLRDGGAANASLGGGGLRLRCNDEVRERVLHDGIGRRGTWRSAELTATGLVHGGQWTCVELRGTKGVIRFLGERVHLYQAVEDDYEPDSGFQWSSLELTEVDHPPPESTYVLALTELVDALEGRGELRSDGRVGLRSLEMVMAIYQSQLAGNRPVHFPLEARGSGVAALREAGEFVERE